MPTRLSGVGLPYSVGAQIAISLPLSLSSPIRDKGIFDPHRVVSAAEPFEDNVSDLVYGTSRKSVDVVAVSTAHPTESDIRVRH